MRCVNGQQNTGPLESGKLNKGLNMYLCDSRFKREQRAQIIFFLTLPHRDLYDEN